MAWKYSITYSVEVDLVNALVARAGPGVIIENLPDPDVIGIILPNRLSANDQSAILGIKGVISVVETQVTL